MQGFFAWFQRKIAESFVAGVEDGMRALDRVPEIDKREVSEGVVLLLDAKPARKTRA